MPVSPTRTLRARWLLPLAVFALALAGYLLGIAPGLLWGDSAEMQILAAIGGVAHPTGYPLFTLVGRVFTAIPGGELAFRANLLSATFAAASLAMLVAFLRRHGVGTVAAIAAAITWGTTFTFWSTAQRAEVYSLAVFVAIGALWCTLGSLEHGGRARRLGAGFLLGLTLAGHMAFAPVVAVAGLTLVWRVPRQRAWLADQLALLLAFMVGLSPYLYLVWADSAGQGLSYLRLVELAQWPLGAVPASFRPPFARLAWLLTARNKYPSDHLILNARILAKNLSDTTFLLTLFEFGPVPFALALWGAWRERGSPGRHAGFLLSLAAASLLFSLVYSGYKILSIFLIPCYLIVAIFAGYGLQLVHAWLARGRWAPAAVPLVLLLSVAGALLAHSARLATYDHPLGPMHSSVIEEDDIPERHLLPTMAGLDEPRRFVESVARTLPDSALVVCEWREFMALLYLQRVERRRNDLTLQPCGYPKLLEKIDDWQTRHALAARPVVVVSPLAVMSPHLTSADTLRLSTGQSVVITRTPLVLHPEAATTQKTPAPRRAGVL